MLVLWSIFVLCLGAVQALAPELWWEISESWKSNATEPSDRYVISTRISGIIFSLVGLVCLISSFFVG